jgi:hypothetical protein
VTRLEITSKKGLAVGLLSGLVLLLAVGVTSSGAQDLNATLARAEAAVAKYQGELPTLQRHVSKAEARYRAAAQQAAPPLRTLRQSQAEARGLRHELVAEEQRAQAAIAESNENRQEENDEQVRSGVGFGLAALVAGFIALAWGWFRASDPVAALTRLELSRAIGLCVGGGLLVLIVGAVLGSSVGAVGALGSFMVCLGFILPTALLLARHSAEVQRGRSKPLLRRERLPIGVTLAIAGLMLVVFLGTTGSAVFAPGASSEPISPQLEEEAEGPEGERAAEELEVAQEEVEAAQQQAAAPLVRRNRARGELASARRDLHRVQSRLAAARSSQRSFARRLVALEATERRQLEKEEARALREQEKQEALEAQQAEEVEEETASECDPNYSGCLDPYSADYDCDGGSGDGPDYTGTVSVLGEDHYGLDANNNGIGCE